MNPIARCDAADKDMIPEGEAADAVDIEAARADGNILVGNIVRGAADG
jgi:hypothetical protein